MPQLFFKREFFEAIRQGRKTTTLRRWKSCLFSAGNRVFSPGLGWLAVVDCKPVKLEKLSESDAKSDGFASLDDLHRMLKKLYPNQSTDGKRWFKLSFRLDEPLPARAAKSPPAARMAASPKSRRPKPGRTAARSRLARRIRADLDKAVQRTGSLFPL